MRNRSSVPIPSIDSPVAGAGHPAGHAPPARAHRRPWPAPRIEHLYLLLPLAFVAIYGALVPLPPNDFWWYLRVGQVIVEQGRVPTTNLFAWTVPLDQPYLYNAWLGALLYYLLQAAGGLELAIFARNVMLVATFALIGAEARRRSGSWALAGLAVALAGTLSVSNLIMRPQNWSWLPFVVTLGLLGRFADRQLRPAWLIVLPPLMIFWVNAHGAFVFGVLILGAYLAGEAIRWRLGLAGALGGRAVAWLAAVTAATAAVTLANPFGVDIWNYLLLMANHPNQRYVSEWAPPTLSDPIWRGFYAVILLLLAAFAFARRRPSPSDLLLVAGFLWLAWSSQRSVTWFSLVVAPILVQCLARPATAAAPAQRPAGVPLLNLALAAFFVAPIILVQPWFVWRLPLPATLQARIINAPGVGPLLSTDTPVGAVEYLRAHPGGRLFNEMGYGSYLTWALPDQPVFVDTRVELYPLYQWTDYLAISGGQQAPEVLARYGADRVLLSLDLQPRLARALAVAPGWVREYADAHGEVWRYEGSGVRGQGSGMSQEADLSDHPVSWSRGFSR